MTDDNAARCRASHRDPGPDLPGGPYTLGLFRIVIGSLFTCHGIASLFGILGRDTLPAGTWPGWYAAVIQLAAGTLVTLGLGTRTAAFLGSGSMAFAYFDVHQRVGLLPMENGGEPAALFCWTLLLLTFTGPGAFAATRTGHPAPRQEEPHLGVPV
ncbi:putative oxidoreductase [Streptomyces sp. KhCrAH-43]|nr:DoxX family membrane protein [Streptomyces sp. SID4920]MYX70742.1 DoxX family membrane protein [Streptomyces sp. SID8373]RAJ55891.1 putative oxidoreductase [Streptomyces sp. KhCrAH-43]